MNRRRFLAVSSSTLTLAGCLGQTTRSDQSTTTPPSATTTPPETETDVETPPCPERPDSFTSKSTLAFAIAFEKAYVKREVLHTYERVISLDVDVVEGLVEKSATQTNDGWLIRFTVKGTCIPVLPRPKFDRDAPRGPTDLRRELSHHRPDHLSSRGNRRRRPREEEPK